MANWSQARPNILPKTFLASCFLLELIETENLGKAQALGTWSLITFLEGKKYIFVKKRLSSHPKQITIVHNINLIIEDHQKKCRYQDH